jgi:hypothetical protein
MSNLEELGLDFVILSGPIIDGHNLQNNIINHMTKLKKFTFNICSINRHNQLVNLPSNQYIQNTFRNFKNQIISSVDYLSHENNVYCHIYSYPYTWSYYDNISNNFRGGLFKYVRKISLHDERPFEHEFFLQIAQSFPFIEELSLRNHEPQNNNNQQWSIIQYSHLTKLDLAYIHQDYVEQFLIDTKTCLLNNNIFLNVDYFCLQEATENFTRDAMRVNCAKIKQLFLHRAPPILSVDLKDYFPYAVIE